MTPWLVLQLADSAFPVGGFAHSAGLEAAAHWGEVANAAELRAFVSAALWQAGLAALPFVSAAHGAPDAAAALDARCDAFLSNHVANRASRTQGRAFLATCAQVFPAADGIATLQRAARARALNAHHAVVFGATLGQLGLALADAQRVWLHGVVRGVASAAVRLGIVGPLEAQRLLYDCGSVLEAVFARCAALSVDDAAQPAPVLDVLGATHDGLYSRLFQS